MATRRKCYAPCRSPARRVAVARRVAASADDPRHRRRGIGAAVADRLSEPAVRAVLRRGEDGRARRIRVRLRRSGFLERARQFAADRRRHDGDRCSARRNPRVRHGAHGLSRQALDRAGDSRAELRLADGAVVRVRRRGGTGRLLFGLGDGSIRRGTVGPLLADRHGRNRGTYARAERLHLCVVGAEKPRLRCRGSGARRRRVAISRRSIGEPAADRTRAAVLGRARILSSASSFSGCRSSLATRKATWCCRRICTS